MSNWRTEYRAVVSRPASILDSPEDLEAGYVIERTAAMPTKDDRVWRRNVEESHKVLVCWEERKVQVGNWQVSNE